MDERIKDQETQKEERERVNGKDINSEEAIVIDGANKENQNMDERIKAQETQKKEQEKVNGMNIDNEEVIVSDKASKISENMDEKIKAKEKRNDEKEKAFKRKQKEKQLKKKKEEERKVETLKKETKQRKQKQKDAKKKLNKKVFNNTSDIKVSNNIPNIKQVPRNCEHLVNDGDVVYVVPGDGCCAPNCAAAYLFHDEVFGPKLRRNMNCYIANHWNERYKYITQCSENHPFVRNSRNGEVKFTEPLKLFEYLKNSEDSAYLWSDSEDLSVISDMYQIRIKIITTKGSMDKNPTVNWIHPTKELEKYAEIKNVKLNDMVLLHEDDLHFNLIVSKDSDLACIGSLSYRHNIGPLMGKDEEETIVEEEERIETDKNSKEDYESTILELKRLQKELKSEKESKKFVESEYFKCEQKLKEKTEEKLKIEVKDLKQIINLEKQLDND